MTDKGKFRIDTLLPMRDGYTISRNADMGKEGAVTYFSMGAHTTQRSTVYDSPSIYLGCRGEGYLLAWRKTEKGGAVSR